MLKLGYKHICPNICTALCSTFTQTHTYTACVTVCVAFFIQAGSIWLWHDPPNPKQQVLLLPQDTFQFHYHCRRDHLCPENIWERCRGEMEELGWGGRKYGREEEKQEGNGEFEQLGVCRGKVRKWRKEQGVERGRKIGRKSRWRDKQNLVKKRRCSKREGVKRWGWREVEERRKRRRRQGRVDMCQTTSVKEGGRGEVAVDVYGRKLSKQHL